MQLTKEQLQVLEAKGHLLVTGGPGSGKTTVSILKVVQIVESHLRPSQKVLFLSFARATVARVVEAIEYEQKVPLAQRRRIDVETYHSFFWRIIKAHGYLVGLPRRLNFLTPPAEAIALSSIRSSFRGRKLTDREKDDKEAAETAERIRLASEEGRVCFDLFAPYVAKVLHGSDRIRRLAAAAYPVIVLDEFQDTNAAQWQVVRALGTHCRLIALADPEQRIYDWIGADPERLNHFRDAFKPTEIDLSTTNHRSAGTDIGMFGNDVLKGQFRQKTYAGVTINFFEPFPVPAMTKLVTATYAARRRLVESGLENWSLAVLVPTKKMTRLVSDTFRQPPAGLTEIPHSAIVDMEATILAAEIIAHLLQPHDAQHFGQFVDLLCNYFQGKGGDEPSKESLEEATKIRNSYSDMQAREAAGKSIRKRSILLKMIDTYAKTRALKLTGDPDNDWRAVRHILEEGECARLKDVAIEARNIRILDRGTQLRQALSEDWRNNGAYRNALTITRQAFVQEHFATSAKPESGVVVMNMHKAKGKQFDEVIIFERWPIRQNGKIVSNVDRIVRFNDKTKIDNQSRQNFRVSVTRGKRHVTILTPKGDPCVLLPPMS
jgi:DNA helicase-2/ATP-dependent DNA helicase PcrA